MFEAVQRFAAYNIGALAVTGAEGKVIGIVSERDYVSKVILEPLVRECCCMVRLTHLCVETGIPTEL